jgi:hypothetical protein
LRNLENESATNPFSSFSLTISQMLNFISSDYGALEPFQSSSAAVRTLRALYIIIITIFFLNTLIALLNLKIKVADKNAENLYHLQMASLQAEIELGMLSSAERARRDWFPEWFSYSMTETEKWIWEEHVKKSPLKWTEQNSFDESKDHAQVTPLEASSDSLRGKQLAPTPKNTAGVVTASKSQPTSERRTPVAQSDNAAAPLPPEEGDDSPPEPEQLLSHDGALDTGLGTIESFAEGNAAEGQEPASSYAEHPCKVCGLPGRLCTSCRTVAYCGKEHQRIDWKAHKTACKGKGRA